MNALPQPGAEVLLPTAAVVAIAFGAGSFWGLYAVALPIEFSLCVVGYGVGDGRVSVGRMGVK